MSSSGEETQLELLNLLLNRKLISAAQADLVKADHKSTGMTVAEILIARHWVSEQTLAREVPDLLESNTADPISTTGITSEERVISESETYQNNLITYRQLMRKILGDAYDD